MLKTADSEKKSDLTGNEKYTGYVADLAQRLAQMGNFSYELKLVKDGAYGTRSKSKIKNYQYKFKFRGINGPKAISKS
jgi:hypothetical protein